MISVDVSVRALGATPGVRQPVTLADGEYNAIPVATVDRQATFGVSFEEVAEELQKLPRFFLEPDGSFVWVGDTGWQLDGQIADRDGRVMSIEIKGTCPVKQFERLLGVFGWPQTEVVFEVRHAGVFLGEGEFRRFVSWTKSHEARRD